MQALQALWSARTGAAVWIDLGWSRPAAAVQWCCSILIDNRADVPRCADSLWLAALLLRGHLCWSEQGSAEKQDCCLTSSLIKKSGRERNIQCDPLPPRSLPLSWSIKNILELRPCLCSSVLEEDFCQDTDPLWILQMSLHLFFLFERQKSSFRPLLGPLQSRAIRRFIIKRRLRGDLWNYSWALVTNCKDIPWDVSSNEPGIYYTMGKRGA